MPLLILLVAVVSAAGSSHNNNRLVGAAGKKKEQDVQKKDVEKHHLSKAEEKGIQEQLDYVRGQLSAFLKARDEFSAMQQQVQDRFKSDETEIDRLVERQHKMKEDAKDAKVETDAFQKQENMLQAEEKIYEKKNQTKEAVVMKQQIEDLKDLTKAVQGSTAEIDEDQQSIDRITAEGKKLYSELQLKQKQQTTIEAQLKVLEKQQARLEEKVDDQADSRSSYTSGILDNEDEDGEDYESESAAALEHALGWNQDKLEEQATNAEDALKKGIGGGNMMRQIGGMMGMMHAVR